MEKLYVCARNLGLNLGPGQLAQFSTYYRELLDWNQRINLTGITGCDEVQIKHFCDSLTVALALAPFENRPRLRVLDVGTGAGFPGIPLKILLSTVSLTLLESTAKKAAFLGYLKEKLGLADVEVITGRAEEIAHLEQYREKFDVVLSRAVAPMPALVELTLPFCAIGGCFIAQKKVDIVDEVKQAAGAIGTMGGALRGTRQTELAGLADKRLLVVIDKVSPTPSRYPRRPGMPAKRPILSG